MPISAMRCGGAVQHRLALEQDVAAVRRVEPADAVEQCRLAGAVRADQPEDLAFVDRERDAVERDDAAKAHRDIADFEQRRAPMRAPPRQMPSARRPTPSGPHPALASPAPLFKQRAQVERAHRPIGSQSRRRPATKSVPQAVALRAAGLQAVALEEFGAGELAQAAEALADRDQAAAAAGQRHARPCSMMTSSPLSLK